VAANDNTLWFTESNGDKIGQITTNGLITGEFPLAPVKSPAGLVLGGDGNYYITDSLGNQIAQFAPSTQAVTVYPIPTANSSPSGISLGPANEAYFTEKSGSGHIIRGDDRFFASCEKPCMLGLVPPRRGLGRCRDAGEKCGALSPCSR